MMRLQWLLLLSLSLYIVHVLAIILPDETDSASASSSSTAAATTTPPTVGFTPQARPTPAPLASNSRTTTPTPTTVVKDTSTDIAENIAELDVDLLDRGHSSKEVQDSDGGQRQNYASKDSGATVLDHAPGTKGSVNLLVPDKDRYMLIPCATEKKWIVISLSEDIHADEIALANYEKFSSTTREFLVLGSINYPSDTWVVLGNFTAANHNGEQLFEFHEKHHVRYIKLRLMSHYGSEYYCTMMDLLWDVIQTMKAGIMITLVLSVALLVFSLCRWILRCLTACHRRAARREWFRRLDVADTTESSLDKRPSMMADDTDEDIDPLTHSMHHRLDRSMRFGSSYDDNAIQRNTMYRRIVNGFRQHHVQTKGQCPRRGVGDPPPSISSIPPSLSSSSYGARRGSIVLAKPVGGT
ncbi:hypothetical protein DYB25_006129 [Aphanomyces astaci]|uniref:SUN domain-containing protein n=1 Tax=Aphanomyces astaci TaxID=112090 RepID=A0A397BJU3_APHAT|nr:hypothetical protein DYB25_006129 [Aphanomyces astaci]